MAPRDTVMGGGGQDEREISVIMRCKVETVNYHVKGILRRLCATNKAPAVSEAMRLGLLVPGASEITL